MVFMHVNKSTLEKCVWLNQQLIKNNLVKLTWGNASIRKDDLIFIKPSGIKFEELSNNDISVVDMAGNIIQGKKPSVDLEIHLQVYRNFNWVYSVIHTHSTYATSWAQSNQEIPILGTTHADYYKRNIPICDELLKEELENYEFNLGKKIVDYFLNKKIDPKQVRSILLPFHGTVSFSETPEHVLECAIVLEEIAKLALYSRQINGIIEPPNNVLNLFDKHFERKNGIKKYYGQ